MQRYGRAVDTPRQPTTMVPIPTLPEPAVPSKLPPHVRRVRNRAGREYLYLTLHRGTRQQQQSIRLPDDPASPEFWAAYADLMRLPRPQRSTNAVAGLIDTWQQSPDWHQMAASTKVEWSRHCGRIRAAWGELEVRGITPGAVLALRDAWGHQPGNANNLLRCLSAMLAWSVPRGWRPDNPCREVPKLKGGSGYPPWPWDVLEAVSAELARTRSELRSVVRLALYTGQRLGDVLAMRWDAIDRTAMRVRQQKTGKQLWVPLHRELRSDLAALPRATTTILATRRGRPWTDDGFQASWRTFKPAILIERGLVFHGLRKSAVVMLLEAGATTAEVQAITGQSLKMVEHYARQVSQQKLAAAAILKWEAAR